MHPNGRCIFENLCIWRRYLRFFVIMSDLRIQVHSKKKDERNWSSENYVPRHSNGCRTSRQILSFAFAIASSCTSNRTTKNKNTDEKNFHNETSCLYIIWFSMCTRRDSPHIYYIIIAHHVDFFKFISLAFYIIMCYN